MSDPVPQSQPLPPLTGSAPVTKSAPTYETDRRDRAGLALSFGVGILLVDLFLSLSRGTPGLGTTLLVLAWEGVMLWYARGPRSILFFRSCPALLLTVAVLLLAAYFSVFSNRWLWTASICALPLLMVVQMYELYGLTASPWDKPFMLVERLVLLLAGLFELLPAAVKVVAGTGRTSISKRLWYVLGGLGVTLPLLGLVVPLLVSADALFGQLADGTLSFFTQNLSSVLCRVLLGALLAPFLFGVLYGLRRPRMSGLGAAPDLCSGKADPAFSVTVLGILDLLYLFFVGVQFQALFGDGRYMETVGLSFADYARSGFFQLVWVSAINLVVVLALAQLSARTGRLWRVAQILSTAMIALSGVLLVSAAWRMSLYVGTYGLSFKRLLTYWGMVMLAILFAGAMLKLWRKAFPFFRVLFSASLIGWLLLNAANSDALIAHYNVEQYLTGNTPTIDLNYLLGLSYDALPALERLDGSIQLDYAYLGEWRVGQSLDQLIADRRTMAQFEASDWHTWNLSAYLAGRES